MKKIIPTIILLLHLFTVSAYADGTIIDESELEGALDANAAGITGELDIKGNYDAEAALKRLFDSFVDSLQREIGDNIKTVTALVAVALMCSAAAALYPSGNTPAYINIAACFSAAMLTIGNIDSIVAQAVYALNRLSDYSHIALPAVYTAAAVSGSPISSGARYAAVTLSTDIIISAAQDILIPLVYAYLAITLTNSVFDNQLLKAIAKLIKWAATTITVLMTMGFSAYIGLTGVVAASTDALAVKTTKTVISTALPVVGGIISDASGVVLSAAALIRNSAGVFSVIAVLAMCAGPFAALSVKLLLLKAVAAVADAVSGTRVSVLLSDVSSAMGLLLGLLGSCGILMFISFTAALRTVSG